MKFLLFSTCKFLTRFDISVTKNSVFLKIWIELGKWQKLGKLDVQ